MKNDDIVSVFDSFFNSRAENMHTCLPGKIETFDPTTRKASVKPLVKIQTKNGSNIDIPAISDVPVIFPSSANFSLLWNVKRGDGCLLLFAETGIGNFLNSAGQVVNADDLSRFSLTDAICLPGLFPFSFVPIRNVVIESTVNNKLKIENKIDNLKSILEDFMNAVKDMTTTGGYSVDPGSKVLMQQTITRLGTLLE